MAVDVIVSRGLSVNVEGHDVDDVDVEDGIVGCGGCRGPSCGPRRRERCRWSTLLSWVL